MSSVRSEPAASFTLVPSPVPTGPLFPLVEGKLAPPRARAGTVARTALVDRLRTSDTVPLVAVVAPAGYGKTTLLRQWAQRDRRPFAWLSIDETDNDPAILLSYIAAGLDRIERIDPDVFGIMASPGASMLADGVPRLGAALSSMTRPLVLVLDDIHLLHDRDCIDVVASLAEYLPPRSQLAIASRAEPPLALARVRAQGHLLEIGMNDLALAENEATLLLRGAGLDLPAALVGEIIGRTEGWPAGVYLAALSILAGGAPGRQGTEFAANDRFVADYFRSELLSRLAPADVRFLTRTAVLDRMSGGLCDAVLDTTGSADVLESLERSNLFLVPLDRRREWYRYHHLFRDLLRSELKRREPGAIPRLSKRAGEWFEAHNQPEIAVEYAHAGGDTERLARLVGSLALPLHRSGRTATLGRWFAWFDDPDLLRQFPAIAVFGAWIHAFDGRARDAERWADAAEAGIIDGTLPDGATSIEPWLAVLRAAMCRDGVGRMRQDAQIGVDVLSPRSPWRAASILLLGEAHLLAGDAEAADSWMAEAVDVAESTAATVSASGALGERASIAFARGNWVAAEALVERSRAMIHGSQLDEYVTSALTYAVAGRLALRRGDVEGARHVIGHAQRARPRLTYALPWLSVQVRLEIAHAYLSLADPAGARTMLGEVDEIFRRRPDLGILGEQALELRRRTDAIRGGMPGASTLTAAELRLLPFLPTYLSFREIAQRLFVSPNTVKTQAISVYGKLGASSRSEAIQRAVESGVLDPSVVHSPNEITRSG